MCHYVASAGIIGQVQQDWYHFCQHSLHGNIGSFEPLLVDDHHVEFLGLCVLVFGGGDIVIIDGYHHSGTTRV